MKGKIYYLEQSIQEKRRKRINETEEFYNSFLYGDRLRGDYEVLICEKNQHFAEWFALSVSEDGLKRHAYFDKKTEIMEWIKKQNCRPISYQKAIGLLGDAVRQNYKYQKEQKWMEQTEKASKHLQRIWIEEYYNQNSTLQWLLRGQDLSSILELYFFAICNKDAALMYDLLDISVKSEQKRDLFMHHWNHPLDELDLFDFEVIEKVCVAEKCEIFLLLYGNYQKNRFLEIDVYLQLQYRKEQIYILKEKVLEVRRMYENRQEQICY